MPPRARVSRSRLTPSPVADAEPAPPFPARPKLKKAAPRSRTLSTEALEQLGARRLAELLMAQAKIRARGVLPLPDTGRRGRGSASFGLVSLLAPRETLAAVVGLLSFFKLVTGTAAEAPSPPLRSKPEPAIVPSSVILPTMNQKARMLTDADYMRRRAAIPFVEVDLVASLDAAAA